MSKVKTKKVSSDYKYISEVTGKSKRTVQRTMRYFNDRPYINPIVNGREVTYTEGDIKTIRKIFDLMRKRLTTEEIDILMTHKYKKTKPTLKDTVYTEDISTNVGLW